jgi:hypothetical protein
MRGVFLGAFSALSFLTVGQGLALGADLRDVLASRLGATSQALVFNLPPRPGAWPGAVFTYDMNLPVLRGRRDDPALARGERTNITATDILDVGGGVKGGWALFAGVASKAADTADISINIPDVQVVDISYDEINKRIQQIPAALKAAKQGRPPLIIFRAYEGTPTISLTKKLGASNEAWANLARAAAEVKLEVNALSQDRVVYGVADRIVFAFETMKAVADVSSNDKNETVWKLLGSSAILFENHMKMTSEIESNLAQGGLGSANDTAIVERATCLALHRCEENAGVPVGNVLDAQGASVPLIISEVLWSQTFFDIKLSVRWDPDSPSSYSTLALNSKVTREGTIVLGSDAIRAFKAGNSELARARVIIAREAVSIFQFVSGAVDGSSPRSRPNSIARTARGR